MADNGISGIVAGTSTLSPSRRGARTTSADPQATSSLKRGGSAGASARAPGQIITLDGRSFDKTAPRGTYLDILV